MGLAAIDTLPLAKNGKEAVKEHILVVNLVPMSESEFRAYVADAIPEYAQDNVDSGRWSREDALQRAEQEYAEILPAGLATKDHYLFTLKNEAGMPVGILWFAAQKRNGRPHAFVYDVKIDEQFRRRGYGEQAFQAMEARIRELGLDSISLHAFGNNHAARAMYEKLGYITTNVMMTKQLQERETNE
jgi:ribosomal protein S18 acetylase RimI-like enzyme